MWEMDTYKSILYLICNLINKKLFINFSYHVLHVYKFVLLIHNHTILTNFHSYSIVFFSKSTAL